MSKTGDALKKIVSGGGNLGRLDSMGVFSEIMSGKVDDILLSAFLTALKMKGETVDEIVGAAQAMRSKAFFISSGTRMSVDTCGTGGDGLGTFNISTASAFIAAGAGVCVAKHGNRSATSKCGSADVLAQLGFNLDVSPVLMEHCLQVNGIAFLFAPRMHPAMRYAASVRKSLGFRTVFNILGPLVNPAGTQGQVVGVFDMSYTEVLAQCLSRLGVRRAFVAHSYDGLDEISPCAPSRVSELKNGTVKTYEFNPRRYLDAAGDLSDLNGGDPRENAEKILAILSGGGAPAARSACLLNAAAAVVVGGLTDSFEGGLEMAEKSLSSGAAMDKLKVLVEFSKK